MPQGSALDVTSKEKKFHIKLDPHSRNHFKPFIVEYMKGTNMDLLSLSFTIRGIIEATAEGGLFVFVPSEQPTVALKKHHPNRTFTQNSTLRMVEKWIYYAQNEKESTGDGDIFWIHEGLLEQYAPKLKNPETGEEKPKRSTDLNTKEMGWLVHSALNTLAAEDLPKEVMENINMDFKRLWESMYEWRFGANKRDPFLSHYSDWKTYVDAHKVCEFTRAKGSVHDPLIRMHIISAGADGALYEEPWNWINALQSVHQRQHTEGWGPVLASFPHMKGKVKRCKEIGKHKGVPECQLSILDSSQKKSSQPTMF